MFRGWCYVSRLSSGVLERLSVGATGAGLLFVDADEFADELLALRGGFGCLRLRCRRRYRHGELGRFWWGRHGNPLGVDRLVIR